MRLRGIESRPFDIDLDMLMRVLADNRFNMLFASAMDGQGYAFFETELMPPHPKMNPQYIPELVRRCHANDIMVYTWLCFNLGVIKAEDFIPAKLWPEWRMQFIEDPNGPEGDSIGMCALCSPYREKLGDFYQEIMRFGFDGAFIDGFYAMGSPVMKLGCVCDYCRARFRADTGQDLPHQVDWNDAVFKRWVRWRYERMGDSAEFLTERIRAVKPDAVVMFNELTASRNPPDWYRNWESGCPWRRHPEYGAGHEAGGVQVTNGVQCTGLISQVARASNPEDPWVWTPITGTRESGDGGNWWDVTRYLPPHELSMKMHALAAITNGAVPWFGGSLVIPWMGGIPPRLEPFREINAAIAQREPYFGGDQVKHCAMLMSQGTRDFYGSALGNLGRYAENHYGIYSMLAQEHLLQEVVLDDHLEAGEIGGYGAVILSNAACMSDRSVERVREYVSEGGVVIGTHETSLYDEAGERRKDFGLAEVFGASYAGVHGKELPFTTRPLKMNDRALNGGNDLAIFSAPYVTFKAHPSAEVSAETIPSEESEGGEPAVTIHRFGKGVGIYFGADIGSGYFRCPHAHTRRILASVITRHAPAPIAFEAPTIVLANAFAREEMGAVLVHLMNFPYASNRPANSVQRAIVDELIPIRDIKIRLRKFRAAGARQVIAGRELAIEREEGLQTIRVDELLDHDIVRIDLG